MLEIDRDFIAHIVRKQNLKEVLNAGVKESDFMDKGRERFRLLVDHYDNYGCVPDREIFRTLTRTKKVSFSLRNKGKQPTKFYLDRIVERRCQLLVTRNQNEVAQLVQGRKWKEAADAIYRAASVFGTSPVSTEDDVVTLADLVDDRLASYRLARKSKDGITGYRLPWHTLNLMAGGYRPTDFALFAGETGIGKSWLLCRIIKDFRVQNLRTLVILKEMPAEEFSLRVVCVEGGFNHSQVILGRLPREERLRYIKYEKALRDAKDVIFAKPDAVTNAKELRRLIQRVRPHTVLVDGTYLLAEDNKNQFFDSVQRSSRQVRDIALMENVFVAGTCQLSLEKKKDGNYGFSDLAHFKGQARDATHLYYLVRNNKMEITKRAQLINLKTRKGHKKHVELSWDVDQSEFEELKEITLANVAMGKKVNWEKDIPDNDVKY